MLVTPKVIELVAPYKGVQQTQTLNVKNNSNECIAFKVKTTAPKLYCVRPNSGVVKPQSSIDVTIIFQGLKEEPAIGTKFKDKFLIVSIPCEENVESANVSNQWNELVANNKTTDIKVKVNFNYESTMNTIMEEEKVNNSHIHNDNSEIIETVSGSKSTGFQANEKPAETTSSQPEKSSVTNSNEKEGKSQEKISSSVEPPAVKSQSSNELRVYLIAVLLLILAFLISRFF